jgi:hypothetical protein
MQLFTGSVIVPSVKRASKDQYTKTEIERRFTSALERALSTPRKPHVPLRKTNAKRAKKNPANKLGLVLVRVESFFPQPPEFAGKLPRCLRLHQLVDTSTDDRLLHGLRHGRVLYWKFRVLSGDCTESQIPPDSDANGLRRNAGKRLSCRA